MTVKKDGRGRTRDYKAEYAANHASPEAKKDRACRNKAHARHNPARGKEVDHKKALSKGGKCGPGNERVVDRKTNRTKGAK